MFVVTMTQRSTDPNEQHVRSLHKAVTQRIGTDLPGTWSADRAVYQQVFTSSHHVIEVVLHAMRLGTWHAGVGIGSVTASRDSVLTGSGVKAAEVAVALAAKQGQLVPLRVEAAKPPRGVDQTQLGKHVQSVLQLLGHIVSRRSEAEWAVIDRLDPGVRGQQRRVAEELDMTVQAVSQAIKRSLYNTEHEVRSTVSLLLEQTDAAVNIQSNSGL